MDHLLRTPPVPRCFGRFLLLFTCFVALNARVLSQTIFDALCASPTKRGNDGEERKGSGIGFHIGCPPTVEAFANPPDGTWLMRSGGSLVSRDEHDCSGRTNSANVYIHVRTGCLCKNRHGVFDACSSYRERRRRKKKPVKNKSRRDGRNDVPTTRTGISQRSGGPYPVRRANSLAKQVFTIRYVYSTTNFSILVIFSVCVSQYGLLSRKSPTHLFYQEDFPIFFVVENCHKLFWSSSYVYLIKKP